MSALSPPVSERDHVAGPANARVTLVKYGDFECPHCGALHPIVQAARKAFGGNLRFETASILASAAGTEHVTVRWIQGQ